MQPQPRALVALFLFLSLSWLGACGGPQIRPEGLFEEHVRTFHTHMRWGRWESAASFIPDEDRFDFLGEYDELGDDYQVVEYEITNMSLNSDGLTGIVSVKVESFRLPSTRVRPQRFLESWEWNEHRRIWELEERRDREDTSTQDPSEPPPPAFDGGYLDPAH